MRRRTKDYTDFDRIYDTLYQGSFPPCEAVLMQLGFDVLVLAADEYQKADLYPNLQVILAPGDDQESVEVLKRSINVWTDAAKKAADNVAAGKNVLVTCMAGLNRSGIITAMSLHYLTGMTGAECVEYLQAKREWALSNNTFADYVRNNF